MMEFLTPGFVLVGVVIGFFLAWLLARGRMAAQVEAAVQKAEASTQIEFALVKERLRGAEEARMDLQHELGALSLKSQQDASELRTLSASLSERTESVRQITERAHSSAEEIGHLESRLAQAIATLQSSNERKAALEEQVIRLDEVTRELTTTKLQFASLSEDFAATREATGKDVSRLSAEVASEREAHALVRGTLVTERLERTEETSFLKTKLAQSTEALQASNERRAALEEQATHLDSVTRELETFKENLRLVNAELASLREASGAEVSRLTAEVASEKEAHNLVKAAHVLDKAARARAEAAEASLTNELTELRARSETEAASSAEKLTLLLDAKTSLTEQFKLLANDILEEKSVKFAEQNKASLGQMLDPLKQQLTDFKGKVEEVYVQEGKDRSALAEQVRSLLTMNQQLSSDANQLTKALKGEAKTQGNWGELVLETVLEASGLRKGHEYIVQDSQVREDGSRAMPDVVVNLPEERRLVIDAKVSLAAYSEFARADTEENRALYLSGHLASVRSHIRGLSSKKYQELYGLQSLDFVLMFVPIEPAFMTAVTGDDKLFMDAWEHNVLLVSPSTLLFVVRTVAHLWRQEQQSRNAQNIAKAGAELYDKLSAFVVDLEQVGFRLKQAQTSYDSAHKRLATGNGNVIRKAQQLMALGVKPNKSLPASLIGLSSPDDDLLDLGNEEGPTELLDLGNEEGPIELLAASLVDSPTDLPQ